MPNAWFESGLSGGLWPLRLKPYDDELLSSWLVRLSRVYGMETNRFGVSLTHDSSFWSRDIDKGVYPEVLEALIDHTGTPLPQVLNTTFWGYPSFPAWELYGSGVSPWLLSIGFRGGLRQRPWLQYCPYCLHDDDDPYFRRQWRLTFVTVCPPHHCRLLDRCVACGVPRHIHQVPRDAAAITHCHRCQFDARQAQAPILRNNAGRHRLMQVQTWLLEGLQRGHYPLSRTQSVSMEEFLPVLRHLGRLLSTRKGSETLRAGLCGEIGDAYFEPSFPSSQGRTIEALSVTDRFRLMLLLAWWLIDWPDQFVAICAMAKLTVTDLRSNFSNRPDWYEDVVGQVALGRFAGMKFASYGVTNSNAPDIAISAKGA